MESTLTHLVIFFSVGAAIGYLTFRLRGPKGSAPKYIWWTGSLAIISFWLLAATGIFTKSDFGTHWGIALPTITGLSALLAALLSMRLNRQN